MGGHTATSLSTDVVVLLITTAVLLGFAQWKLDWRTHRGFNSTFFCSSFKTLALPLREEGAQFMISGLIFLLPLDKRKLLANN